MERVRGREQLLVRPGEGFPLFLLAYPKGEEDAIEEIETILAHRLPMLPHRIIEPYAPTLAALHGIVVVVLRPRNTCECLGHCHPRGTESRLARRLASDLNSPVGEIDLAYEAIRKWEPHPISSLAAGELGGQLQALHFQAAFLGVFLHELEHLVFPNKVERDIRATSNDFYMNLMQELVSQAGGAGYGMNASAPPDG